MRGGFFFPIIICVSHLIGFNSAQEILLNEPVKEEKIYKLIPHVNHTIDFEASGVSYVDSDNGDGYFYIVMDSSCLVAKIKEDMLPNGENNTQIETGSPCEKSKDDSDYEGITYDNHLSPHFYIVSEGEYNDNTGK